MEAHEHLTVIESHIGRVSTERLKSVILDEIQERLRMRASGLKQDWHSESLNQMVSEYCWACAGKPYYIVYPVAVDALLRVRLDIPVSGLKVPMKSIAIRFGIGCEPFGITSIMLAELQPKEHSQTRMCVTAATTGREFFSASIDTSVANIEEWMASDKNYPATEQAFAMMRIAVGVCLLGEDSEWVEPDVLSKDRLKFEQTGDPAIVERAKRRGKFGWVVGGNIDTAPHLRRPHLGIRWTGEKGLIPKLVPISGSVVRKKRLSEVPHGYQKDPT